MKSAPSDAPIEAARAPPPPAACVVVAAGAREPLADMLREISPDVPLPIVLVRLEDGTRDDAFSQALAREIQLPVRDATHGVRLEPGNVYVLPPGAAAGFGGEALEVRTPDGEPGFHMPADASLRSLAAAHKAHAIGVLLSGPGTDGTFGLQEISAEGGFTFAQDPATARPEELPRSAIAAGAASGVLDPAGIGRALARIGQRLDGPRPLEVEASVASDQSLARLFKLLRSTTGVDFTHYKKSTLKRRIVRRMMMRQIDDLDRYLAYLQEDPGEAQDLCQDMLIKVTAFFRHPEAFEALKTQVFPVIMHKRPVELPVRIWVPGCSTGEEVYSIAIALLEYLGEGAIGRTVQIFGTDVSDTALQRARAGLYIDNIALDVSPERLRRFFVRVDGKYQISKAIRDACVFARQNAAMDPPFSKLDLVSCRNLLIYFEPNLQRRMLQLFHYALKPTGYMMLGAAETIGPLSDLFGLVDKSTKIYMKRPAATKLDHLHAPQDDVLRGAGRSERADRTFDDVSSTKDLQREADRILMSRYAPAGVVVDEDLQILQFRGRTGPYLEPAPGDPSLHLLRMAREGLLLDVRAAVHEAKQSGDVVKKTGIYVKRDTGLHSVDVDVWPLEARTLSGKCFLVVFVETPGLEADARKKGGEDEPRTVESRQIEQLQRELTATREYMHSIIEEQDATNEELKSANEEILSSNEELHSINEELETAKEELQSTNEELTTVNEELLNGNAELGQVNNELRNLLISVNIPILMLGADLRIRRFTPSVDMVLHMLPTDVGRPLGDIRTKTGLADLARLVAHVLETMHTHEQEVQTEDGRWFWMRIRPYRSAENKLEGAVICWIDIDAIKREQRALGAAP